MMEENEIKQKYELHFNEMKKILNEIENQLKTALSFDDTIHIDHLSTRIKTVSSFTKKAIKEQNGVRKYDDPFTEIEDQIGVRIIVFYLEDEKKVASAISSYFRTIEDNDFQPKNFDEFAYQGQHFICNITDDMIKDDVNKNLIPNFFEIQIKTLFQHAWAQAEHDLGYKQGQPLSFEEKRKLAFAAAQSWGADTIFNEIYLSINRNEK